MKFENTEVFNLEGAFRGLRNPMDSWNKSDSHSTSQSWSRDSKFIIGNNDMNLAQRMIKGGTEQRKFLRQIMVSVDITAPRYWWTEFDTYKIGTVANSCSTMHKLKDYPFTSDMFEIDENMDEETMLHFNDTINYLESLRQKYNLSKDITYLRRMKQALPESFLQKRTVTLNYENLLSMIRQREHHRLSEWSVNFIDWVKTLPYANELLFMDFKNNIEESNKSKIGCAYDE